MGVEAVIRVLGESSIGVILGQEIMLLRDFRIVVFLYSV